MNSKKVAPLLSPYKMARNLVCMVLWFWIGGAPYAQQAPLETAKNSKFAIGAGPLVRIERPGRTFLVPQGYFRSRSTGFAGKDSWWLEALWPDLTPWRENNPADDKEFHAPGGGRVIKMGIYFGGTSIVKFLNRMISEYEPGDPGYGHKSELDLPDDTLDKRIKGELKYGLQPYYVDFNKVLIFLNRNKTVPISTLDAYKKSKTDDWFIQRDSAGTVSTLIRCTSKEVPDPPEASITGLEIMLVPYCEHMILLPKYTAHLDIHYRRVFLPQWEAIEHAVRALLTQFETTQP